jgi:hypothetical protein
LDGVLYHIAVYRVGDEYEADWQCTRCGESIARPSAVSIKRDEALETAKRAAESHHAEQHANKTLSGDRLYCHS